MTLCFEMVVIKLYDFFIYFWGVFNFLSAKKVYAFQVFTPEFCQEFIKEIDNFESTDLPKGRPNTMNNYGVRLYSNKFPIIFSLSHDVYSCHDSLQVHVVEGISH